MRSRLAPRQNVRRQVYKLNQPTRMTEAPARVVGRCLTVVAIAKMIARPNATENAAKIKRGAITCSLLDCLNCIDLPRSIWFRSLPVRRKTWDSFTVTPNRRRHHAAVRFTRMNTPLQSYASDLQTLP